MLITVTSYKEEFVGILKNFVGVVFPRDIYCSYLYNELDFHLIYKATYLQVIRCVIHVSEFRVSGQTYCMGA